MSEQEDPGSAPYDDVASSGRDRLRELMSDRRALALIGGALVAVIALAAFVVVPALTGSSDSAPAAQVARPAATSSASSIPSPVATPASQLNVRDPFAPLVVQGAAASATASATVAPSVVAVPSVDASQLRQLTLVSITNGTSAKVTVNGLSYDAQINVPFAGGFTMTAMTSSSATFTYKAGTQTIVVGQYAFFS